MTTPSRRPATLAEYVATLQQHGVRAVKGSAGASWIASEPGAVRRVPTFCLEEPAPGEVDEILRATGAVIATYLQYPDCGRPANAWLYLCSDPEYELAKLPPPARRNVRRGLRELTIRPVGGRDLLRHGVRAFCDTRGRTGLGDGTPAGFRRYFGRLGRRDHDGYLGAWKDGQLAAFVTILHVDDWVELGAFSMDSMLSYRPNDALMYAVLSEYLGGRRCAVVSYGVSSIQTSSKASGLHRFKRKFGFTPVPVHRAFDLHPSLRPLANQATLLLAHWGVLAALWLRPRDRRLKKAEGALACMRGTAGTLPAPACETTPGRRGLARPAAAFPPGRDTRIVLAGVSTSTASSSVRVTNPR